MLDTTVYIDVLRGATADDVDRLLENRICHHSTVCLAELTHAFGRLDPGHATTKSILRRLTETIEAIPDRRLHAPDADHWGQAGILAGVLGRLGGPPNVEGQNRRFLNDALLAVQARSLGAGLLTRNVRDFDILAQMLGRASMFFYEAAAPIT